MRIQKESTATPLAPPPPSKKAPPTGFEPVTHGLEERGQILVGLHGPCLGLCGLALALWGLWALMGLCARNVARGGAEWGLGRGGGLVGSIPALHAATAGDPAGVGPARTHALEGARWWGGLAVVVTPPASHCSRPIPRDAPALYGACIGSAVGIRRKNDAGIQLMEYPEARDYRLGSKACRLSEWAWLCAW